MRKVSPANEPRYRAMSVYSGLLFTTLAVGLPYWLIRMASGKHREGLGERLGRVPRRLTDALDGRETIWVHAVSVGEVLTVARLAEPLQEQFPNLQVVLSTTTRTGQRLARERFGAERVFYFPLDFSHVVRRYLKALRPRLLILAETELWPNLLVETERAGVPVVVVNARISDRSLPRYRRLRRLWKPLLSRVTLYLAQSEEDARRLREIGAPGGRVQVNGNLKFDVRVDPNTAIVRTLRNCLEPNAKVLVAGSTLEGEEVALLNAWPDLQRTTPELVMVLAPRHPERFVQVAALLEERGLRWVRRSAWFVNPGPIGPHTVFLLDSIGELASVYSLASVAFIGGSLVNAGGHNPLEPAQFGVPTVIGEHYENFRVIVDTLRSADAIAVTTGPGLVPTLRRLLNDPEVAYRMATEAERVFAQESGAADRTLSAIADVLREAER